MGRFLNFREELTSGQKGDVAGQIKGNISVTLLERGSPEEDDAEAQIGEGKKALKDKANKELAPNDKDKKESNWMQQLAPKVYELVSNAWQESRELAEKVESGFNKMIGRDGPHAALYRPIECMWVPLQ